MIWGDQWLCPCGWHNVFVRARCRNCGEPKLPGEKCVSVFEAIADAEDAARRALTGEAG